MTVPPHRPVRSSLEKNFLTFEKKESFTSKWKGFFFFNLKSGGDIGIPNRLTPRPTTNWAQVVALANLS